MMRTLESKSPLSMGQIVAMDNVAVLRDLPMFKKKLETCNFKRNTLNF